MRGTNGRPLAAIAAVIAVTVLAAGCGSDGGDSADAQDQPKYSAAQEPVTTFIVRMAKLLATTERRRDCADLEAINGRSLTRFTCPADRGLRKSMADFKVRGDETYGTGAVVDYTSGEVKDGATIVLFVALDRSWAISRFGVVAGKTVGTSDDDSRDGYDETMDGYLAAVRDRDCSAYKKYVEVSKADEKTICKGQFLGTKDLAKRLAADPKAEPRYEGGNGTFGFYTLETRKPEPQNLTISIVKSPSAADQASVVLDVGPSPTAAEQRQVQREFERQQRHPPNQPERSRSRKAN